MMIMVCFVVEDGYLVGDCVMLIVFIMVMLFIMYLIVNSGMMDIVLILGINGLGVLNKNMGGIVFLNGVNWCYIIEVLF